MDKDFYDEHRGARCPDRLFSKDVRKIKQSIDTAMDRYERTVTPAEIEALFMANNPYPHNSTEDCLQSTCLGR